MIDWWQLGGRKDLRKVMYRKEGRKEGVMWGEGEKEGKTSGAKTFSELARPLASAYVCPCGHRESGHIPHQVRPSTAISNTNLWWADTSGPNFQTNARQRSVQAQYRYSHSSQCLRSPTTPGLVPREFGLMAQPNPCSDITSTKTKPTAAADDPIAMRPK